ncbi:MAG: aminoglycoside phosphotransferase family protein [Actinomycetaceae bacterium]|nr:aminoglycoside phosphotransferase family protein [Arcanobacterium sp.]MDD7505822.1 aminoglycoside phosphotransferase family protein [Actinomycetaceae bacterium]
MGEAVKPLAQQQFIEALYAFVGAGADEQVDSRGSGHINDTFMMSNHGIVLQRINTDIFSHPQQVLENIVKVTDHIRKALVREGKDPETGTLRLLETKDGDVGFIDSEGDWWRAYRLIAPSLSFDKVQSPHDFYNSGRAFGHFQKQLADFPAASLHETIPHFHDTRKRFGDFQAAVEEDAAGRAGDVQDEIRFVLDREDVARYFSERLDAGDLPLRVTHNDTKLNNVLFDAETGEPSAVIDLDTVMPGLAIFDYGDSIRFGASTGLEDEPDLSKVWLDLELFDVYTKGFLEGCEGTLSEAELDDMAMAAKVMTYECGMRFLADHLQGDVYFKVSRPNHNLDRARTQFKLVADMETKWDKMREIVAKYR